MQHLFVAKPCVAGHLDRGHHSPLQAKDIGLVVTSFKAKAEELDPTKVLAKHSRNQP